MSMDNWILSLWESLRHQIALPDQWQWAPVAGLGVLAVAGLMMMLRGARWAPGFAGVAFLAIGGLGGQFLGNAIGIPIWPAIVVGGLAGLFVGVWAFRLWQAVMLAACCIVAATSVYYVRTLEPEVRNWVAPSVQVAAAEFALPDAGTVVGEERPTAVQELTGLWNHLTANVDGFEGTIWTLALITGLAGLLFGLFLPNLSRSLWAATLGVVTTGVGVTGLLQQYSPDAYAWLLADAQRAWAIVIAAWIVSVLLNWRGVRKKSKKGGAAAAATNSASKPAMA